MNLFSVDKAPHPCEYAHHEPVTTIRNHRHGVTGLGWLSHGVNDDPLGVQLIPAGPVLVAILALPSCWADRKDDRVPAHLARVAYAISAEANDADEAAALVSIGRNESAFCIAVQHHYTHSGALSMFQLEGKTGKYPGPFLGLEIDPMRHAAYAALDVWRNSHQCGQSVADRFTGYAARPCGTDWPSLKNRVNTYYFAKQTIEKEMRKT